MLYSKTCEYAIRALTCLASKPQGDYMTIKDIAQEEGLPPYFLSKILQILARHKILDSAKGPTGGFALARPKKEIFLSEIVFSIEGEDVYERCAVGFLECNDETPCPMHEIWTCVRDQILEYLKITSLAQLAEAVHYKREKLAEKQGKEPAEGPRKIAQAPRP
ncbi:MAG: Rrf2 family transcriptional regulator [Acidobacteriota bacterium]|nr:MAG: Rrf2 family transcriptional regulator [Acidobacteriota bacterium]